VGTTPGTAEQRFPGFDVVGQAKTWDKVTAEVVLDRLRPSASARFFSAEEQPTVQALLDRLLAQDDEPRVRVFEVIDRRLADRMGDGYRYLEMPEDPEAWRASIAYLESDARARYGRTFDELAKSQQLQIIETIRTMEGDWHGLPSGRVFALWMRYACSAFYSHPWAWNEIGFGGPAYPRGYKNLGLDRREPWEVAERDSSDPVPWAERAESARRRHADGLSEAKRS
jgi:hypothetical protein